MIQGWTDTLGYYRDWLAFRQRYLRVPGVQAAIWQDGDIVLAESYGQADVESGTALTNDHLFRIASHSKSFTAVAVLQLVSQGRLSLDDHLGAVERQLVGTPIAEVQIRELLSHSAGVIRDSTDGDFWQGLRDFPDVDELIAIAGSPTTAVLDRNDRFKYSNIAFGLLGLVIETVSGKTYRQQLIDSVITPLGLANTGPEFDPSRNYAAGHSALAYSDERRTIDHVDTRAFAPATGFYADARDLVRFFAALLPGDTRLLQDGAKRQLLHPAWEITGIEDRYGLGVSVIRLGERELYGHGGGYPGHITRTLADAERRTVVSVLTNAIDGPAEPLASAFSRLTDLAEGGTHAFAGDEAVRFTGRFASLWGVLDVALLGGRLYGLSPTAVNPAEDATPLEVVSENTVKIVGGSGKGGYGELMPYEFAADGSIVSLRGVSAITMKPL